MKTAIPATNGTSALKISAPVYTIIRRFANERKAESVVRALVKAHN